MEMYGKYEFYPEVPESINGWEVYYEGEQPIVERGELLVDLCRASRQYDSILLNSSMGCGWKILAYPGESTVLKVYKPIGVTQIILNGTYIEDQQPQPTKLTMDFTEYSYLKYTCMIITLVFGNNSSLPEISEHISTESVASISDFKEMSHELQINGSSFCVSLHDYMDPNKGVINSYQVRAIPNYYNIALTRTFQKFLIGGCQKKDAN